MSDQRYIKEGWLMKRSRSSRVMSNWRRRFFRLTRTELMYFKAPEDSAPRRRYELTLDSSVLRSNDQGYALCIVFQSAPGQPQFYMQAENEVEKDEWITAIYNAYRRTPDVSRQTSIPEIPKVVDPSPSASAMPEPPPAPVPVAPSRTMLEGVIHGARRLKAADMNGKSDPYCVVKLVGKDGQIIDVEEKRTDYITATLDPVWDKPFLIGRVVDLNLVKAVRFELWDHDTFKNNDSLGSVEIPFTRFHTSPASTFQSEPIDDWFRVEPPKKISLSSFRRNDTREKEHAIRDWGELHIRMSLTGPNLVDFLHSSDLAFVPTSPVATASDDHSDNRLEVTVIAAKDLISADVNKSSDPYCELTLLDAHEKPILGEYATTAIMHRTRNPAWANEHHVFGLISPISKAASLKVRVIDYDKSNRNDPLGFICISLDQLSAHKWTEWHVLQPEEGMSVRENLGAIQLQMWLIGERRGEHVRQLQIDKEVKMKTHNQSVEELELENAQYQFHDAACMLDGARIPCAVADYQARDPRFYGINGCIHYLNTQIPRAHREKTSTDESFQARSGLEGLAQLEVAVVQTSDLVKPNTDPKQSTSLPTPYAVIEMDPSGCVEECKRTSAPLSARKSKRIAAAAGDERNTMFSKRAQAEVSVHRAKLVKNEMRSEKSMEINPDKPILKVEILTGHGLSPADMNGYSDPYCTLSITDRATGKDLESEKKRTAVISKTLNPVWTNESFVFGNNVPLSEARSLLIHVKDHNNIGRSTPLGRVEIPLYDLCRASADLTSISSRDIVKRYELKPEPWMKKHAKDLGELCIKTEVVGDATVLAELMQRVSNIPMEKSLSILSFSEANIQSDASMNMSMSAVDLGESELEDETTEVIPRGAFIQTSTSKVISVGDPPKAKATWRKEKFSLSLSYPGVFRDAKYPTIETHSLHLRVHEARNLSLPDTVSNNPDRAVPVTVDFDAESGKSSQVVFAHPNKGRLQGATSIYFTVIPVLGDGTLVDTERQQSLTVYNTRDPSWPEQDFTFGKFKDISNVSYLSLHLYERDLQNDKSKPLSRLLTDKEKEMNARLRRFQLHKLSPSGEVDDNGFDILQYGQRVLAFRCCHDSGRFECGRFYPARVQNYIPFPHDEYDVLFEDAIETINELRNFISFDVQGIVQAVRNDGRVDVNVESANGNVTKRNVRFIAQPTQLIPVNTITEKVKMVMARRVEKKTEQKDRWVKMKHKLSGIAIDVMSASDLLLPVSGQDQQQLKLEPACRVTLLAIPNQTECIDTNDNDGIKINDRGELIPTDTMSSSKWTWKTGKPLEAIVKHAESQSNDRHLFEQSPLVIGNVGSSPEGEIDYSPVDPQEAQRGVQLLKRVSSIIIQVVVGVETDVKSVGYVKVDLATLQVGHQDLQLRIIPPSNVPYVKFGGTVFLHIATWSNSKATAVEASIKVDLRTPSLSVTGLTDWYNRQAQLEAETSTLNNRGITWIERRQILRASLRPTENSQIDALHTVLVIIMKRIVDILREIRQFEDYETLSVDEMLKCRKVHTVNSNLNSEFLGRTMDKLSHEVRKEIVVGLENELLSLAGLRGISPEANCSREEWVRVRTERQKLLREKGDFFMRDQTSALVLSVPRSFTGEGMISWILRKPPVLWEDKWKIYCKDVKTQRSCHLGWNDPGLEVDPDAIQAPKERLYALQWMSALCAAGFVENVTPSIVALTELGKRNALMEDRTDRFYRLREVDMWMEKKIRDKSLFPLDLVQEFDCHRSLEYADEKSGALTSEELIDKSDDEKMPAKERQATIKRRKTYAKKLTDHCDGFLGMHTLLSNFIFSLEANKKHTVAETTEKLVDHLNVVENILWDWKYCLFVPHRKHLYMYEHVSSTAPVAFIDMASGACRVAYNSKNDGKGGWMDIVNPTVCVRKSDSHEFVPVCSEMLDKMTINRDNGDKVIEVKTKNAQRWIQMLSRAGVRVDMCPGQVVLLKQLNPLVLQQKCIDLATQFDRDDLEGSFQRLLNRFFEHDRESSYNEHDRKARELRAQVRSELKKPGGVDDTVMAYFGNGQLKSKPKYSGNFKKNSLYTGRILRIRSPYCDEEYPFKETYKVSEAPEPLRKLLTKYNVTDEKSWSNLPIMQRDMLLLYDIEYSHANERLVEEGLIRENIRTNEGDLDPKKVRDRCTDLNILFKATDLEDCVMRMVKHRYHHKPLGILKIPIKTISPHRTIDAWYSLAPANNMLKKSRLGQIRVELKLVQKRETKRSFRIPVPLASLTDKAPTSPKQGLSKLIPGSAKDKNTRLKSSFELGQEPSFVKISILEGRGLRVADLFTSDPFVEIVLLDEQDSKERDTNLKTDIKMKTLNPKWQNQEFLLGKTEKTKLSDKKGVLLRVMDYDATSANDPLGCVTIEFQRGETGYIRGLVLKQAGKENGSAVTEELKLNDDNRFDVEAALLPAAGQSKPSDGGLFSKKKTPGPDGLLGKLRFLVEIMRNENYVDPNLKKIETTFSAEVAIKNTDLHQEDWTEYKCYFQPHGEGGLRIQYNPASEDLGRGNSHKLSELLHSAASLLNCDKTGKVTSSFSDRDAFKILGRTYDLSKVDYFDVRVEGKGKVFVGHLGKSERKSQRKSDTKLDDKTFSLKYPTQRANFQDIKVALTEEQSKEIRTLTLDLNLIGILRADRVRRILSDTFRLVGLTFDPQTLNLNNGRHDSNQLQNDVDSFLWDTCRANIFPGRNTAKELLAQVRAMSQASKLHWKTTPQLLAYVFEFVFLNGEKDRLSFVNAVALDAVLNRWSHVLNNVAEAKDHLTGRLHGKKTPHLMEALFTECDWTGFDLSSLNNDSNRKVDGSQNPLRVGDRASAQLPLFKHVGVPVDVRLPGNEYAAAIIIRECTAGRCDIKLCATVDGNTSQTTKTAHETRKVLDRLGENSAYTEQVRRARVMQHDSKQHPDSPYLLEYLDDVKPREEWQTLEAMSTIIVNVEGNMLVTQLQADDCVRVWAPNVSSGNHPSQTCSNTSGPDNEKADGSIRPGKVTHSYGNAHYDIAFVDGQLPADEKYVIRNRLTPVAEGTMYDGIITSVYLPATVSETSHLAFKYDMRLQNGEIVRKLGRSDLRVRQECFPPDMAFIGAIFCPSLQTLNRSGGQLSESAKYVDIKLQQLWWGSKQVVKVYVMLPAPLKAIQVRSATTNKLIEAELMERNEDQPRFLGQYHGFVKGETLEKDEKEKLEVVYTASCKRQAYNAHSAGMMPFEKNNCFYLIIAPPLLVRVHGRAIIKASSPSELLFRALASIILGNNPGRAVAIFQRLLRAKCNSSPQPEKKVRTVVIKSVSVEFGSSPQLNVVLDFMSEKLQSASRPAQPDLNGVSLSGAIIDIKFLISVPYADKGSLNDAVGNAYDEATTIAKQLKSVKKLSMDSTPALQGSDSAGSLDVEAMSWSFEDSTTMTKPERCMLVEFTDGSESFDTEPIVSLECEPLEDIRVRAHDSSGNVHDLHFPIHNVVAEAKVRRELSPFIKATVLPKPLSTDTSSPHYRLQFQKGTLKHKKHDAVLNVPPEDIKYDVLSVRVLEASKMTLKGNMGAGDIYVKVLLVSSDFNPGERTTVTPFGLKLSSTGEILQDTSNQENSGKQEKTDHDKQYSQNYWKTNCFTLRRNKADMTWGSKDECPSVEFKYPDIDIDRVSEVRLVLWDKKTASSKIGVVTISLKEINEFCRVPASDSKLVATRKFSIHRDELGRKVVGKISLKIARIQDYDVGAEVYARQLEENVDFWTICPKELLRKALNPHENVKEHKLARSFLALGPPVSGGGKVLLKNTDTVDMELLLQKITKVQLIFDSMNTLSSKQLSIYSMDSSPQSESANGIGADITSMALDQLRLSLQHTKSFVREAAQEMGLGHLVEASRLPWSSDPGIGEQNNQLQNDVVVVEANVVTCTSRVRHTVLKLYELYKTHFIPKLDDLYELDAKEDRVDLAAGEKLLSFFDKEVEELEVEDQRVCHRVHQRIRLAKMTRVLDMIMRATLRVKVMDENRNDVDMYLGTACIPLVDLLDQQPQDSMYKLLYMPPTNLRGVRRSIDTDDKGRGFVQLRLHLKFSESSFIEEAITVYKTWKDKYILQHETARRRIHQAVIPVQRRRWTTIKGYLDELTKQADTKLHWERTPALLSLVWDIFVLQESSPSHKKNKPMDADEKEYAQSIAKMADKYREIVMKVHKRWVNLQPKLDELMTIQAAALIDAQRTPQLLDDIKHEVEGLDVGLSTAWRQVKQKWQLLLDALEGLVNMQDRKLNLTLAPQLLKSVEKRCSKGLSVRHAEAVSNIQSRWMAITQPNGPLSELRLMEKKGLHWRRTHELLLLLDEQCEGFADVDAKALDTVQNSWEQVQHWLHEIVQMQAQHSIDCEQTPFILEKMHLWRPARIERQSSLNKSEKMYSSSGSAPSSPKYKDEVGNRSRGLFHQSSNSRLSSDASFRSDSGVDDNGQLEGMAEWYAIEEAKYELERIPYHCITTAAEKKNWLAYSKDGKDSRLHITQEDMVFTPANVRIALEERGVIPKTSNFHPLADAKANAGAKDDAWVSPSLLNWKSGSQSIGLPISVKEEIEDLEAAVEKHRDQQDFTLPNPERVAELYEAVQSFGKTDLLWKVDHVVSRNRELAVPENYQLLLREMAMRQISTTEVENLVKSLAFTLQKEVLLAKGITVPLTANPTTLLQLMHRYQVKEVLLPQDTSTIQSLLQERGMDRKGDPVILRGIRIGTRSNATIDSALHGATLKGLNTGLGIIDTQIEILRKSLLFEALRKRNSLIRTFAGESHVLDDENERTEADMFAAAVENAEVDMSGDYLTLVERFQRLLVHESYTKRLAEYAAMDRCMRALLGKSRDEIVTKEEIAMELHSVNKKVIGANYRLPPEAFTEEELIEAANAGRIRTPSAEMLARCPQAKNAPRMAHYAAISYAASVYQEVTSFRSRVDTAINRLQDTFPFDEVSSLDGVSIPKERGRWTLSQSIADWLLGFDASKLSIKRKLSAAHRQRLEWASAAFTLRNRWLQSGLGWCDHRYGEGVGVKILLDRLLLFEAANKMDMVKTEMLLREVRDKCARLRDREREAQAKLEERFQLNLELLEKLVIHAERCTNNRKLHSEETPVLLYKLEQACVVPTGLNERHREAYHTVATHWLPQREHLAELVKMHREGTFSITRTPELLGKMKYHTEGKAGSEELNEDKVAASAQRVAPEFQASFRQRKLNEVRLGQRKEPSSLHLDVNSDDDFTNQSADDVSWKELSHSQRVVQPLSPHEKQTSWKVVNNAVSANAAFAAGASSEKMARIDIQPKLTSALPASPRRKLSLSDELKELLKTPAQWLLSSGPQDESIRPELYFPKEVVLDVTSASLSKPSS